MHDCDETYGFLPCSSSVVGSLILMVMYGVCILKGANLLSDGSELLLEILDPGIIGGLVLPVIGALPEALIVGVAGLTASSEDAKQQVMVGIGTLAGSTIMLLTIVWAGGAYFGRCDRDAQGVAIDKKLTSKWDIRYTGVTTDRFTPYNAGIMLCTLPLYLIIQVPAFLGHKTDPKISLAGCVICLFSVGLYCASQVVFPEMQKRRMELARQRLWRMHVVRAMAMHTGRYGPLVTPDGQINGPVMELLFDEFDHDRSGDIDEAEVQALLLGLAISNGQPDELQRDLRFMMSHFDHNGDGLVDKADFCRILTAWASEKARQLGRTRSQSLTHEVLLAMPQASPGKGLLSPFAKGCIMPGVDVESQLPSEAVTLQDRCVSVGGASLSEASNAPAGAAVPLGLLHSRSAVPSSRGSEEDLRSLGVNSETPLACDMTPGRPPARPQPAASPELNAPINGGRNGDAADAGDDGDDDDESDGQSVVALTARQIVRKAAWQLLLGGVICAFLSEPLVNAVTSFSTASHIPTFYVAFVFVPFASNAQEVVTSLRFAQKRKKRNISLMFSQVYGAVTMNSTLVLGLFLLVVHVKQVPWTFSAEFVVIVLNTVIVAALGMSTTNLRTLWTIPVVVLYPLSLAFVYVLDYVANLDKEHR
ncbi:hypothetical protein WJX72_005726 [[Myrmecia] bisecta]|uniref:EF-hand domain-containing protein n=1 Tax=[Myrmecia] bisecta TaxID=41462 RepID=A0AAW1P308_9CHLO